LQSDDVGHFDAGAAREFPRLRLRDVRDQLKTPVVKVTLALHDARGEQAGAQRACVPGIDAHGARPRKA
jgi:hypothetical protein